MFRDPLLKFRQSPYIQVDTYGRPTCHAMLEKEELYDQRLYSLIDHIHLDAIVQNSIVCFSAVITSGMT